METKLNSNAKEQDSEPQQRRYMIKTVPKIAAAADY